MGSGRNVYAGGFEREQRGSWAYFRVCEEPLAALREQAASTEDAFDAALSARGMDEHREDLAAPPPVPEIAALEGWIWCPRRLNDVYC